MIKLMKVIPGITRFIIDYDELNESDGGEDKAKAGGTSGMGKEPRAKSKAKVRRKAAKR